MKTNKDRLNYLEHKIRELNSEIVQNRLEDSYYKFCKKLDNSNFTVKIISDEEWQCMLPKEKKKNFFSYYYSLRLEHEKMINKVKIKSNENKLKEWLDCPWVKISLGIATLGPFISWLLDILSKFFDWMHVDPKLEKMKKKAKLQNYDLESIEVWESIQ